jgi:hypothetical protein
VARRISPANQVVVNSDCLLVRMLCCAGNVAKAPTYAGKDFYTFSRVLTDHQVRYASQNMKRSPTLEGFKLLFREPSLGLAEIAWRWSFGAAVAALLGFSFFEYLDTLPVSNRDLFLLRTRQPGLISRALAHILTGSGARFMAASMVLALALAFAWVIIASFGRAATLKGLLNYFWKNEAGRKFPFRMSGLVGLNFLRVGAVLAALVGFAGAMVLGGMVSSEKNPSPGAAVLVFMAVVVLVWIAWAVMNWVLSLASVFVVAGDEDTFGAIGAAVGLVRDRIGAVIASSFWFGLAHVVAIFIASSVVIFLMAFAGILPRGVAFGGVLFAGLLYFAVVDLLYLGRLGSYVWLAEGPAIEPVPEVVAPPVIQPPAYSTPLSERVDPDDLILSDIPVS